MIEYRMDSNNLRIGDLTEIAKLYEETNVNMKRFDDLEKILSNQSNLVELINKKMDNQQRKKEMSRRIICKK
jgi:hypothetical protein